MMALSAAGVKIPEAGDIPPCHSQVSQGQGALLCPSVSPPGYGFNPTFSQGGPPRIQDKATNLPPPSLNSPAQVPSSISGKRQTCDIEGTFGAVAARDQNG